MRETVIDDAGRAVSVPLQGLDTAKAAGVVVLAALGILALLRKGFGGVNISLGD